MEFIQQYIQRHGFAPTLMEIAESLGLHAASTVHEHLSRLENKGYIKRNPGYERSIEVISQRAKFNENETAVELPVLGEAGGVGANLRLRDRLRDVVQRPAGLHLAVMGEQSHLGPDLELHGRAVRRDDHLRRNAGAA